MRPEMVRLSNKMFDLVREAVTMGISPEEFKQLAAEAWGIVLADDAKTAKKILAP